LGRADHTQVAVFFCAAVQSRPKVSAGSAVVSVSRRDRTSRTTDSSGASLSATPTRTAFRWGRAEVAAARAHGESVTCVNPRRRIVAEFWSIASLFWNDYGNSSRRRPRRSIDRARAGPPLGRACRSHLPLVSRDLLPALPRSRMADRSERSTAVQEWQDDRSVDEQRGPGA
jgi:hypothetical protein